MPTQTGSIDMKGQKAAADIGLEVDQHFWYDSSGAHVTEVTQEEFTDPSDPSYHSGGNTLMTSTDVKIRDGVTDLAIFGSGGAVVGENASGKSRTEIGTAGMQIIQNVSGEDKQIAHLGYGLGATSGSGTSNAPYYTLGSRKTTANQYDSSATYNKGDLCKYGGKIFVCTSNITTPEAWNSGHWNYYIGNYSVEEGWVNTASGYCSHAEGSTTIASDAYAHAEGYGTFASGFACHVEGHDTSASDLAAHAEGHDTSAFGAYSHAEGVASRAGSYFTHAEGNSTLALGNAAHAEGGWSEARDDYAHAQNYYTIARSKYQTALGKYNIADNADVYSVIIGNGTADNARSNALTVDWSGRVQCGDYSGTLTSIFDLFYPVGSYYETSDTSFDPNVTWGGTWSLETEGQVHIGAGSNYTVGATGGAKEVTLDVTQIPSHYHQIKYENYNRGSGSNATMGWIRYNQGAQTGTSEPTGGGQPHENMPPYIVVNRWHRTA